MNIYYFLIEIPADPDKFLIQVEPEESNYWHDVRKEDIWEKVLIVLFFYTSANVDTVMVTILNVCLAMLAVLYIFWFGVLFVVW